MFIRSGVLVIISRPDKTTRYTFFKTLRFRILLIIVVMGILPTILVSTMVLTGYERRAIEDRSETARTHGRVICSGLLRSDYLKGGQDEEIEAEVRAVADLYGGRARILNESACVIRDSYNIEVGHFIFTPEVEDCLKGNEKDVYNRNDSRVSIYLSVLPENSDSAAGCVVISFSTLDIIHGKALLTRQYAVLTALIAVVILVAGYVLSGRLVEPFRKLTQAINTSSSYQDKPLFAPEYVETDQIAVAFNHMLSQVKTVDDSREEFVSNVSHELKTPLASMKVLADSLNSNPDATLEMYQEFMKDISEEIDRENVIISDLMELVKLDGNSEELKIESCDIRGLLELVVKRLQPIAEQSGVDLRLECFRPVTAEIDETKIILSISNLVENAIKYGKPGEGWVQISLNADKSFCYISVADNGIGMSEDVKAHIFERFYRGDKSHSSDIKGTGLGLSIARSGIAAHKGAISVESKPGEGTTFSVRFPLVYVA